MRENQLTHCSRRGFVCHLAGAVTTVSVLSCLPAWAEGRRVAIPLKKVPQLKRVGNGVLLRGVKGYDILVIRTGKKTLSALDPTCTHKQCEVSYEKKWGEIRCDCHGSVYSTGGVVEEGPAEQDLTKYPVYLEKKRIVIELPAETGDEPTS